MGNGTSLFYLPVVENSLASVQSASSVVTPGGIIPQEEDEVTSLLSPSPLSLSPLFLSSPLSLS